MKRLEPPHYTIRQVARMAGWNYWKMKRHLFTLNKQLNGLLLRRNEDETLGKNRRWSVTLAALRKACPEMFDRDEKTLGEEIDALRDELRDLKTRQIMTASQVGRLTRKVAALEGKDRGP